MSNFSSSAIQGSENEDTKESIIPPSLEMQSLGNQFELSQTGTDSSNNPSSSPPAIRTQTISAASSRMLPSLSASNNDPFSPSQYMFFPDSLPFTSSLNNPGTGTAFDVAGDAVSSATNAPSRPSSLSTTLTNSAYQAGLEPKLGNSSQYQDLNQFEQGIKVENEHHQQVTNNDNQMNFYDPMNDLYQPTREEINQMEEEIRFQSFLNTSIDEYGDIKPNQYNDSLDLENPTSQDFSSNRKLGSEFETLDFNPDDNAGLYNPQEDHKQNNPSIDANGGANFIITDYSTPGNNALIDDNQNLNDDNLLQNPQTWQRRRGSISAYSDVSSAGAPSPSPCLSPSPYLASNNPTISDNVDELQSFLSRSDLANIDQMTSNLTLGYSNISIGSPLPPTSTEFEAQHGLGLGLNTGHAPNQLHLADLSTQDLNYQYAHKFDLEENSTEASSLAPEINIDGVFLGNNSPSSYLSHVNSPEIKLDLPPSPHLNSKPTNDLEISLDRDDLLQLPIGRRAGGRRRAVSDVNPRLVRLSSPLISQPPSPSPSSPDSTLSSDYNGKPGEVIIKIDPAVEVSDEETTKDLGRGRRGRNDTTNQESSDFLTMKPPPLTRLRSSSTPAHHECKDMSLLNPDDANDLMASGGGPIRSKSRTRSPSNARDYILELAAPSAGNRRLQKHPSSFACHLCERRFTRAYNLRSHLRTHTNERPFACAVCGKAFARQHDRKRHEALHSGERKFQCEGVLADGVTSWGCGRKFARADALGRHFRTDAGRECIKLLLDEEQNLKLAMGENAVEGSQLLSPGDQSTPALTLSPPSDQTNKLSSSSKFMGLPASLLQQYPSLMNQSMYWNDSDTGNGDNLIDD